MKAPRTGLFGRERNPAILMGLLLVVLAAMPLVSWHTLSVQTERRAEHNVDALNRVLSIFRGYYATNVAAKVLARVARRSR